MSSSLIAYCYDLVMYKVSYNYCPIRYYYMYKEIGQELWDTLHPVGVKEPWKGRFHRWGAKCRRESGTKYHLSARLRQTRQPTR